MGMKEDSHSVRHTPQEQRRGISDPGGVSRDGPEELLLVQQGCLAGFLLLILKFCAYFVP